MASRYGYQDDERYGERRGRYGRGESEGRYGREYPRSGEYGNLSRVGRFKRDEGYFGGGGGAGYGEGYSSSWDPSDTWDVGNWRDASFNEPRRRRYSGRMSDESDYGDYGYRSGSSRERYTGSSGYGGSTWRGRDIDEGRMYGAGGRVGSAYYGSSYPERERGYMGGREQYGRGEYEGEDRGFLDKASDEIASWFGDEEAERRREMDARRGGQHRGRGPRNYTRSDSRIEEDINDRLTDYPYIDASDIEVEVNGGEVVLTGNVDSRYEKRLAEDIVEDISGVKNVENRIRVESSQSTSQGGWTYSDTAGHTETGESTGRGTTSSASTGRSSTASMGSTTGSTSSRGTSSTTGRGATGTSSSTGRGTTGTSSSTGTTGTTGSTSTAVKSKSASGGR
jgi:osmotically-inducible protein OsmY